VIETRQGAPGTWERHWIRRQHNALLDESQRQADPQQLQQARRRDREAAARFRADFESLVQKAAALEAGADSETVLALKDELDRAYSVSCTVPGDQRQIQEAIRRLIALIMAAIRRGAGNDAYALAQLDEEDAARRLHFELQHVPLVADLTHPDSPVDEDELVPLLLGEPPETLVRVMTLFDADQAAALLQDAREFLAGRDPERALAPAWQALAVIEAHARAASDSTGHGGRGESACP